MKPSELISRKFGLSGSGLASYVRTCPYRYKTYPIEKRNSDQKRMISQPSKDLKAVQRFLIDEFLRDRLPVHKAATAYKADTNILDNAVPHLENSYLLKMDFVNFFPSIQGDDFKTYLLSKNVEDDEAKLLVRIFFKMDDIGRLCLSIGSPGSPIISNALMYEFDRIVLDLCDEHGIAYTRYSDDLTFSTNTKDILFEWPDRISAILEEIEFPTIQINAAKTVFSSKKFNRHVTGITITNQGSMSIGRSRKRQIRSAVYKVDELSAKEVSSLRGYIAFANQVEPGFTEKLEKKYPDQMAIILNSN